MMKLYYAIIRVVLCLKSLRCSMARGQTQRTLIFAAGFYLIGQNVDDDGKCLRTDTMTNCTEITSPSR